MTEIESLVPHAGPMCLLDRFIDAGEDWLHAEVTIRAEQTFFDAAGPGSGVGAWLGVEFMAQAVAAWAGLQARRAGHEPRIGFLLGSRRCHSLRDHFALGETLRIEVLREFEADNGMSQFDCRLLIGDEEVSNAQLTVFGPENPQAFIENLNHD